MKEASHNPMIDPELEARIVALMLGEASDFERDQLNRLIEQRPELATFKEQIQRVHGLLQDVGTGESVAQDDDWKLCADKRSKVLAVIRGEPAQQPGEPAQQPASDILSISGQNGPVQRNAFWSYSKVAAVLCLVGSFGVLVLVVSANRFAREAASVRVVAGVSDSKHWIETTEPFSGETANSGETATESPQRFAVDEAKPGSVDEAYFGEASSDYDHEQKSKEALSGIRGSLDANQTLPSPYYLRDDVQYYPAGPQDNPPRETATPRDSRVTEKQNRVSENEKIDREWSVQASESRPPSAKGQGGWAYDMSGDGNRPQGLPANPGNKSEAELSLPMILSPPGDLSTLEDGEPADSSVSVPDAGTILLGGVKRMAPSRGEGQTAGEPTVSFPLDNDDSGQPQSGAGAEGERMAESREDARPEAEEETATRGAPSQTGLIPDADNGVAVSAKDSAASIPGARQFGQGQPSPAEPSQPSGGARPGYSVDLPAPPGAEGIVFNEVGRDRLQRPGASIAGGGIIRGFSADGTMLADDGKEMGSPDDREQDEAQRRFGTSGGFASGAKPQPAKPQPSVKSEKYRYEEGFAKQQNAMPSDAPRPSVDDIAVHDFRTIDGDSNGRQIPVPITGTAIAPPAPALPPVQTDVDGQLGYEDRAKNSLERLSKLNELSSIDENGDTAGDKDFLRFWSRPQTELEGKQAELPRRGGQSIAGGLIVNGYVPPMLKDRSEAMKTPPAKKPAAPAGLNEKTAAQEAFSTFSLHVSDVSFKLAQAALAQGEWPEPAKIRIEEFVNAFDYGDPLPSQAEKVACRWEQAVHPFLQQRNLLRVSMRTAAAGRSSKTPLRLTFLLDNSGSMERIDRAQTVRRAFALLAQQLKPIDQVTLISFARQPRLLADKVSGAQAGQLVNMIEDLPSEGGTNLEAALQLAFEKAREQQVQGAQNRIILLTDGAVNLGDANPESLSRMITTMRDAGVAFDAAGISAEGLNDEILEALTRQGDGRYYLLDSPEAADDGFARQIAGALRPSAKNVKVQVEFNPQRVGRYKLLGFEKHRLKQEDFRNDQVDAAEMAAAEAGVAVYQFEAKPDGEGDVGSVSVRFRDLSTGQMIENRWPIPYEPAAPRVDQAATSLRVATAAALLAAKLRGEPLGETVDLKTLSNLISGLPDRERKSKRVGQLQLMIEQARQVSGD